MNEHCEAVQSDLRRYCGGISLAGLFTGELTYLELDALLAHLPPESAFRTARRDKFTDEEIAAASSESTSHGPWSKTEQLLGAIYDAIRMLTHVQIAKTGTESDPPQPLPRPGVVSNTGRAASPQQRAFLERIRQVHAQQQQTEGG